MDNKAMKHLLNLSPSPSHTSSQARVCHRLNVRLVSTPFEDRNYYTNIRKALVAGFFMQVSAVGRPVCCNPRSACFYCLLHKQAKAAARMQFKPVVNRSLASLSYKLILIHTHSLRTTVGGPFRTPGHVPHRQRQPASAPPPLHLLRTETRMVRA